ncbi:MAG TPA: TonB-dependent receptor [Cytophagales bacterium]|jgi:hemoglobin/transferrin/lactoferrin receptor protein|nr:TonB-dependent receptor [Cytophagales bacterium]
MEKHIIKLLITLFYFISNPILSQKVYVVDNNKEPIYNVSFYKKDLSKGIFSNFNGEVDLSIFENRDSIVIQHPTFDSTIKIKSEIVKQKNIILFEKIISINEIVFSVNKWSENLTDVSNKILNISENKIKELSPQTSADLLEKTGEIFVQKSQLGGGSPMIRGFSANRILLSLDGIRMNNAIFRSGNIHNIISIDPNILEGVEILYGPASVMYGSDAIGGAINFKIKDPKFNIYNKIKINGSQNIQYNSSSKSKHYNLFLNIGLKNIASMTSFSFSNFDDLRSGSKRKNKYKNFGKRTEYVKRNYVKNIDETINNTDHNIQKFSNYSQNNFIQKINYKINDDINLIYGLYYSKSSNIPRYDRLTLYDDLLTPKYAEWYYGPNLFLMNKIELKYFIKNKFFDAFKLNISKQNIEESRISRKFNDLYIKNRIEKVDVNSLNLDFDKKKNGKEFFYGYELYSNKINSNAFEQNINTNEEKKISTRYPDGGTNFLINSIYLSYKKTNKKLNYNFGIRGTKTNLKSKISSDFFNFPFSEVEINTSSISGSFGLIYNYSKNSSLKFLYSNGFRSPNLDDVGKIFDSEPGNIIVPNVELNPEYANNFEINFISRKQNIEFNGSIYYTNLNNAIIRSNGTFDGVDSIMYDGSLSKVQTLKNSGKAYVFGFSYMINYKINNNLNLKSSVSFNQSKDLSTKLPLRHSSPIFGQTSVNFTKRNIKVSYYINYNGKKDISNFSPIELNKLYLYTKDGSPTWLTNNISFIYNINYLAKINFSCENIFDVHYRSYSSGISAPGRNFNIGLNMSF